MKHIENPQHSPSTGRSILKLPRKSMTLAQFVRLNTTPPEFDFLAGFSKREVTSAIDIVSTVVSAVGLTRQQFLNLSDEDFTKLADRYGLSELEIHITWTCWFRIIPLFEQSDTAKAPYPYGLSSLSALVAERRNGQSGATETPGA